MSDDRKVGGLEKLVGSILGGIEKFVAPVTKHAPKFMKSAYSTSKDILLQYVCGSVDKGIDFVKEHPVATVAGALVGIVAFPYLYAYGSYLATTLPVYAKPLFMPYAFT